MRVRAANLSRAAICIVAILTAAFVTVGSAGASRSVRGFDGKTVTVAAFGIKQQLPGADLGSQARIERFNKDNEIKGIQINYQGMADDNNDPATAVSEARRLVTQVGVFAIVGDVSIHNPGAYFAQQHVPYFGGGFDTTYCSFKPSTSLWGYSVQGCVLPEHVSSVSDNYWSLYQFVSKKLNKKHPTLALFGQDNPASRNGMKVFGVAATGTGFKVTAMQNKIPTQVSTVNDWTPYATPLLTAGANGQPPDAINCVGGTECLNMWDKLNSLGYKGVYSNGIYSDALVKAFKGSYIMNQTNIFSLDTPGVRQMKADLDAVKPGSSAKADLGDAYGYTSTDMFITALKGIAKKGKSNITPENLRKYASTMTWKIDGLQGPTSYPRTSVMGYPSCGEVAYSDGTKWIQEVAYKCSPKTYPPTLKIG
jgi:hypothetical protein